MRYLNRLLSLVFAVLCAAISVQAQDDTAVPGEAPAAKANKPAKGDARQPHAPKSQPSGDTGAADSPPDEILPRIHGKSATAAADRTTLIDDTAARNAARTAAGIPENLADALSQALNRSPGILVAEAKVRQAEAELNEVRQSVVEELTVAYQQWGVEKKSFDSLVKKGLTGKDSVPLGVIKNEARILYLLGVGGRFRAAGGGQTHQTTGVPMGMGGMPSGIMGGMPSGMMGPMVEPGVQMMGGGVPPLTGQQKRAKSATASGAAAATGPFSLPAALQGNTSASVRRFLETRVDIEFDNQPIGDILDYFEAAADSNVVFIPLSALRPDEKEPAVTIRMKSVTFASALQALSDIYHYTFVFRDYGILVIESRNRTQIEAFRNSGAPMIAPPDDSPVQD